MPDYLPWVLFIAYALLTEWRLARMRSENRGLRLRLQQLGYAVALGLMAPSTAHSGPPLGPPVPAPGQVGFDPETPVGQLLLALTDLTVNVKPEDAPFIRYVSFFNIKLMYGVSGLDEFRDRAFPYEINRHQAARNPIPFIPVDGPRGSVARTKDCLLMRFDLRRGLWTRTALVLVADRDYLFREAPLGPLPHRETQYGRLVTGIQQNPKTLSAGFILNAFQLYRDAMGFVKSDTGHDLLYANERHPDFDKGIIEFVDLSGEAVPDGVESPPPAKPEYPYNAIVSVDRAFVVDERRVVKMELHKGDGFQVTNKPNEYGYVYGVTGKGKHGLAPTEGFVLVDSVAFDPDRNPKPKEVATKVVKGAKGVSFIPKRPVSVADANKGVKDFPKTLSDFQTRWGVRKRQDRLKEFLFDSAVGGIALAADSDPERGSFVAAGGDRVVKIDPSEFGIAKTTFDSKVPKDDQDQIERDQFFNITQGVVKKDGGEAFATLPNGADAEFLFNANEESVAKADPELAKHLEPKLKDPRFPDIQIGYCGACHAETAGYIPFVEQFTDLKSKGIKFNVPSGKEQEVDDFYKGWQRRVKLFRFPYEAYIEDLTSGPDGKPLPPVKVWPMLMDYRDRYDRPVKISALAADFGMTVEDARQLILQNRETEGPPQTRLNQLAIDGYVPRRTYEANVFRDFSLWADLKNPRKEKAKELVTPQVLDDAIRRFANHSENKK